MTTQPLPHRIALIGAGGFLGTNLARHLSPQVVDLRCFGRRQAFPDAMKEVAWISGDLSTTNLVDILAGCDAVIHLASASAPGSDLNVSADADANVLSSLRLFDQCVAAGVRQIVFISSGGTVYGAPSTVPIPESAPTQPISAYGVAKLTVEKYLAVYARLHGIDYRVLRISNLYGPYQLATKMQGAVAAFLNKGLRGEILEIWGDGKVVRDYIYVDDACAAIVAALRYSGSERVFNVGSGIGMSLNDIIIAIETLLQRRLDKRYQMGRLVDVPVNILDCTLAKLELGWTPLTDFTQGLNKTALWMRSIS